MCTFTDTVDVNNSACMRAALLYNGASTVDVPVTLLSFKTLSDQTVGEWHIAVRTDTVCFNKAHRFSCAAAPQKAPVFTSDGLALGQDGDRSLRHLLLVHHRRDLWAPAVRAHPDEMTCLVGLFGCVEEPPAKEGGNRCSPRIRSASGAATLWFPLDIYDMALFFLGFCEVDLVFFPLPWSSKERFVATGGIYLISSSLAKSMTTLALGFSLSRRMTLSNSVGLGSRGILTDWEMHTPPKHTKAKQSEYIKV